MPQKDAIGSVSVGTWARVVEHGGADEEVFFLVEDRDANYLANKIPVDNPMGSALLGANPGEDITVNGPNGSLKFTVLEVGRL